MPAQPFPLGWIVTGEKPLHHGEKPLTTAKSMKV